MTTTVLPVAGTVNTFGAGWPTNDGVMAPYNFFVNQTDYVVGGGADGGGVLRDSDDSTYVILRSLWNDGTAWGGSPDGGGTPFSSSMDPITGPDPDLSTLQWHFRYAAVTDGLAATDLLECSPYLAQPSDGFGQTRTVRPNVPYVGDGAFRTFSGTFDEVLTTTGGIIAALRAGAILGLTVGGNYPPTGQGQLDLHLSEAWLTYETAASSSNVIPPRRQLQRRDGLAGSVPQQVPRPPSVQFGRQVGGYL